MMKGGVLVLYPGHMMKGGGSCFISRPYDEGEVFLFYTPPYDEGRCSCFISRPYDEGEVLFFVSYVKGPCHRK